MFSEVNECGKIALSSIRRNGIEHATLSSCLGVLLLFAVEDKKTFWGMMCRSNVRGPSDVESADKKCVPITREDPAPLWQHQWQSKDPGGEESVSRWVHQEESVVKEGLTLEHSETEDKSRIMEIISNYPILKSFLAGSLSGTCSTVIFQPLDLVKTRLQNPMPIAVGASARHASGMLTTIGSIVQKDNVFGLWKGMTPSLTRCIPGVGLYFMSVDMLKAKLVAGEPSPLQAVAIGMIARSFSGVCLIPVTVVKTRFESGVYQYGSVTDALRVIYRTEGLRGLSCGLLPTLVRDAPFSGLYLMFYTQTKKLVPSEWLSSNISAPVHFSCGVTAGILASLVTQPADVLKTKMQLFPNKFNNISGVVVYVNQKYGLRGYFKGLVPRMLRRTLMAALAWTVYEQLTRNIGLK